MKNLCFSVLFLFLGASAFLRAQENYGEFSREKTTANVLPVKKTPKTKTPVLVELFTSEGCPTCPPAEKVLAYLQKEQPAANAEIITLALHVDYWNRGGWNDRFSSPLFSQRQEIYRDKFKIPAVYTPQMIVDGERYFVGSKGDEAVKVIGNAVKNVKAEIELTVIGNRIKIKIPSVQSHDVASIFLAIAEDDLSSQIIKGENRGLTLRHMSVARSLFPIGRILASENSFEIQTDLQIGADWNKANLKAVVFLQENKSRKILAINSISLN